MTRNDIRSRRRRIYGLLNRVGIAGWMGLLAACGSDTPAGPTGPAALGIVTDLPAAASSGVAFSQQPKVRLTDASGAPFAQKGVQITASLGAGSGTLVGAATARTDADGIAAFTDLGVAGTPGRRTLRFTSSGLGSIESGGVNLAAGPAASLTIKAGGQQSGAAGTAVPIRPQVLVADATGNPVAGVAVTFAATGSTLEGPSQTTDAAGLATIGNWILGATPGTYSMTATAVGLPDPVTFQATATVGPPSVMIVFAGDNQTGVAGAAVATDPAVKITDVAGNPIRGVSVTFSASGDGSVTGASATTDAAGIATVGSWILTADPGANTLTAARVGLTSVVIHATATPVPLAIVAGDAQLGAVGAELYIPVVVRVTRSGLPQPGVAVHFAVTDGGGSFDSLTVDSDVNGIAFSRWTLGPGLGVQHATVTAENKGPATFTGTAVGFKLVTAGQDHACGLLTTGEAYCWGDNAFGQLGDSTFTTRFRPVRVLGGPVFDSLETAGNGNFTCGLTHAGSMWCWGSNRHGQLGDGTATGTGGAFGTSRPFPMPVLGGFVFRNQTVGGDHACATTNAGVAYCWGRDFNGELGDNNIGGPDRLLPTPVAGSLTFIEVFAGDTHSCGLVGNGTAYCWGGNQFSQLGAGSPQANLLVPTLVQGNLLFSSLTASAASTCGLVNAKSYCWGRNGAGQTGDGTIASPRGVPTATSGNNSFVELSGKGDSFCGRMADGSVLCWGANGAGQTGTGTGADDLTPKPLGIGLPASQISVAASAGCMIAAQSKAAYCWGPNGAGQVGDGTRIARPTPVLVRF